MSETAAHLVVRQGPYPNQEYVLTQRATTMGRGPNNDIVFADPEVSRQHAQILIEDEDQYLLKDLGSTNGLFLNGRRVSGTTPLNSGDTISLGESIVLVFYRPGAELYDEDDTPTADLILPPEITQPAASFTSADPAPAFGYGEQPVRAFVPAEQDALEGEETPVKAAGRRGRGLLIGCGIVLLLVFLCMAGLFLLDAYDNGRLLYCGGLRPFWETILGPFGFSPLCG